MSNPLHPGGPMPDEATWDDYVNAHGGPQTPGWWVTLRWYADSEHPRPEVVGPYTSHAQAVSAMEDSLLIDGFATDTNREEWLDDAYVAAEPTSIARMCADYGPRVTLIDPGDHHHFGPDEPFAGHSRSTGGSARNAVLQAGVLNAAPPPASRPGGGSDSIDGGRAHHALIPDQRPRAVRTLARYSHLSVVSER